MWLLPVFLGPNSHTLKLFSTSGIIVGLQLASVFTTEANYYEVEQALSDALEEVRHRIRNSIKLF